jgi:hypothetical protein
METALIVHDDPVIANLDKAWRALELASTPEDTKRVLDLATAAAIYARRQDLSEDIQKQANAIRVHALYKLGTMLQKTERNTGAKGIGTSAVEHNDGTSPTLDELGITRDTSSIAQKLASLPEEKVEAIAAGEISVTRAVKDAREPKAVRRRRAGARAEDPVVYAWHVCTPAYREKVNEIQRDRDKALEETQRKYDAATAVARAPLDEARAELAKAEARLEQAHVEYNKATAPAQKTRDMETAAINKTYKEAIVAANKEYKIVRKNETRKQNEMLITAGYEKVGRDWHRPSKPPIGIGV